MARQSVWYPPSNVPRLRSLIVANAVNPFRDDGRPVTDPIWTPSSPTSFLQTRRPSSRPCSYFKKPPVEATGITIHVGNVGDVSVVRLVTVKLEEQGIRAVSTSDSEERPEEVPSPSESSDERER